MIDPGQPDFDNTPASDRRPTFFYAPADPQALPCVTVVTPFYNEGHIFHETARSVFRQSLQQWEWIIVNDASTDPAALEVLAGYRSADRRIRVVDQVVNTGPSAARNVAFRMARTPYVAHLDSDNLLEPTALEKWLWYLESHPGCSFVKGFTVGFGSHTYLWQAGFHDGPAFLTGNRVDTTSMIRREVHRAVGGFDESIREGLEDWDFWLRCANGGYWGSTLPEYLDWYRRRQSHADRWKTWDGDSRERAFSADLRRRFPKLTERTFPRVEPTIHVPYATLPDELPCENRLAKQTRRALMIVPWLAMGGSDKFNIDVIDELSKRGWELTIATTLAGTDPWQAEFERLTPDIFQLNRFLMLPDYPRFLRYLVQSRQIDVVFVSHSELGYQLLPYLRAHCPHVTFVDLCHIEEHWKNGGYPRLAVEFQELLDLNVVVSEHLKTWMIGRHADADRIRVCYLGVDTESWRPDAAVRKALRAEMELSDTIPVILYAGRICDQKQPRVFAETIRQLRNDGTSFVAVVAGDGPDFPWLRRFVEKERLGSFVRLLGAVPSQRVERLMKMADIFFLPSAWEGIALSIYEAMASGLAVVGAKVGGQAELVTPDCGTLIERSTEDREADEYARILTALLADRARQKAMGEVGRERVKAGFNLPHMGATMVKLFDLADRLHEEQPRPRPGLGLGRASAAQAVEFTRTYMALDRLWHAGVAGSSISTAPGAVSHVDWRGRLYEACRVLYTPLWKRGLERGGAWYFPMADRIKALLLRSR